MEKVEEPSQLNQKAMISSLPFTVLTGLVLIFADPAIAAGIVDNHNPDLCSFTDQRFPNRVSFLGSTEYENQKGSYYIAQARALAPDCFFRPTSTQEVSDFVKLATVHDPCHQQRGNCSVSKPLFSMRGGGHTLWAGAAGAAGGLTVDLRGLNAVTLSADKKMASVGGGSNFADVYPQLVPHNLTVLGGRTPGVAAGGFLSGGGKNFLARRHGYSCDHIFGYEVVLASGQVVYASAASEHHDLWMALKGGSSNFGIITRYDMETFPSGLI